MRFLITTDSEGKYIVAETEFTKMGTYSTKEEALAHIDEILSVDESYYRDTGKSYKAINQDIDERNRRENNKNTTKEYRLKR
jgi:hypothetical protein